MLTSTVTEMSLTAWNSCRALARFSLVKALPPSEGTAMIRFWRPSLGKKDRYAPCMYPPQHATDNSSGTRGREEQGQTSEAERVRADIFHEKNPKQSKNCRSNQFNKYSTTRAVSLRRSAPKAVRRPRRLVLLGGTANYSSKGRTWKDVAGATSLCPA